MTTFYVIDVETTSDGPEAEVIELGMTYLDATEDTLWIGASVNFYCDTKQEIDPAAKAVHHITEEDIKGAPSFFTRWNKLLDSSPKYDYYVAHNAEFEKQFIPLDGTPWICTCKCAMRAWPHLDKFSNQYLRYALELDLSHDFDTSYANLAHRAGPDSHVTAHILRKLLSEHSPDQLLEWSNDIAVHPRVPFGMHKGKLWSEVDSGYLGWILRQYDMDGDVKELARRELARR